MSNDLVESFLVMTITYWAFIKQTGVGGATYEAPVTILGFWKDKEKMIRDFEGKEVMSQAKIHVDQDVSKDGYLFLGTSVVANPAIVDGAYPVIQFRKTPDLDGETFVRTAWL